MAVQFTGSEELNKKIHNVVTFIESLDGMQTDGNNLFYQTPILHDTVEAAQEPEVVQIVKKYIDDEVCHLLDS